MKLALGVFILCAGACSDGSAGPDGPPAIDGVPAIDGASATGPVSVTVRNADGTPAVGAAVATQLDSGEVLMIASTGADGMAILQTVAGGSVTVAFDEERATKRLVTIMGLTFGQSVLFQARPPRRRPIDTVQILPPESPPTGTVGYLVQIPCRFGGQSLSFPSAPQAHAMVSNDCILNEQYDAALTALDADGAALAYTFQEGVTRQAGPIFPAWMTPATSFTLTITHAPCTECAQLVTYRRTSTNLVYSAGGAQLSFSPGSDRVLSISHAPSLPAPETGVSLTLDLGSAKAIVRRSTTDAPTAQSIDLSLLLPQITALAADATGSRLRVQFAAAASTHAPRAAVFELTWIAVNGEDETRVFWTVLTPPPAGDSISLPLLPAELAAVAPVLPGASGDYTPSLTLVDDTAFASFAELAASDWMSEIGGYAPTRPGMRTVTISSRP